MASVAEAGDPARLERSPQGLVNTARRRSLAGEPCGELPRLARADLGQRDVGPAGVLPDADHSVSPCRTRNSRALGGHPPVASVPSSRPRLASPAGARVFGSASKNGRARQPKTQARKTAGTCAIRVLWR